MKDELITNLMVNMVDCDSKLNEIADDILQTLISSNEPFTKEEYFKAVEVYKELLDESTESAATVYFATEIAIDDVLNILMAFAGDEDLKVLVKRLGTVDIRHLEFTSTSWENFVKEQLWYYVTSNPEVFNVNSSGCMTQAMRR